MSLTEPHADLTEQPILSERDVYSPKRVRWPGLLAVAILVVAAVGGVVVTGHEEAKQASASSERGAQPAAPQTPNDTQSDDTRVARRPR